MLGNRSPVPAGMVGMLGMKMSAMLFLLSVALAISVATASAEQRYGPLGGHIGEAGPGGSGNGEFSTPNGVAIEQASGDVYVVDTGNNRVEKFEASGVYLSQFNGATTPAGSFSSPTAVAVDQTTGDVYVVDSGNNVVDKFTPSGEYLCEQSGKERGCQATPIGPSTFSTPIGVAVDPTNEDVYVSDKENKIVDVFTAGGSDAAQFEPGYRPWSLAVDANHNVYVAGAGAEQVTEYTTLGGESIRSYTANNVANGVIVRTVGVDPSADDVFIGAEPEAEGYELFEFNAAGQPLPSPGQNGFGSGFMSSFGVGSPGIAVNSTTHTVYAADPSSNVVDMFSLVTVPDPTTGNATNIKATSATLEGLVNAHTTSGAEYFFQYGTSPTYGSETGHTAVGEGEAEQALANVANLEPGTTYHYRLDATNATGLVNTGGDRTFTTAPLPPEVTAIEPSDVTIDSVIFHGEVNPGSGATAYHFEYGLTESYGQTLPNIGIGAGNAPVSVEQAPSANLTPNHTYHYRLVAINSGGEAKSLDQTFRTLSNGSLPTTPPVLTTGPATAVTQTEATITGILFSEGLPTSYVLELGAAAGSYETRVFGNLAGEPGGATPTATFTNLQPGTTYHYRLVASNAAGTSEGPDRTFTTVLPAPSIAIPPAPLMVPFVEPSPVPQCRKGVRSAKCPTPFPRCKKGFVRKGARCVRKKPAKPGKRRR
jgi:sugar lactone lactonase YvrE